MVLVNGRTQEAQVYQKGLCQAICTGLRQQMIVDTQGQFLLAQVGGNAGGEEVVKVANQFQTQYRVVEEIEGEEFETACDDVSVEQLDPKAVKVARAEEVEYIHKMHLYTKVPIAECHVTLCGKPRVCIPLVRIASGRLVTNLVTIGRDVDHIANEKLLAFSFRLHFYSGLSIVVIHMGIILLGWNLTDIIDVVLLLLGSTRMVLHSGKSLAA